MTAIDAVPAGTGALATSLEAFTAVPDVLRLATERWVADEHADFADLLTTGAAELLAVAADGRRRVPDQGSA